MYSDSQLIKQIIGGSEKAFEHLFRKYYGIVCLFVNKIIKDSGTAEDIAQNIFVKIWINREVLIPEKPVRHMLFVMAKNESFNFLKAKYTKIMTFPEVLPDLEAGNSSANIIFEAKETDRLLKKIIYNMPVKRRHVFIRSRYCGYSIREIAEELDLSKRTVEKHLELALKDLKKKFSE